MGAVKAELEGKACMTVGALRAALAGRADDMPVLLEVEQVGEYAGDLAQAYLRSVKVEQRCDEQECLYLWGSDQVDLEKAARGSGSLAGEGSEESSP